MGRFSECCLFILFVVINADISISYRIDSGAAPVLYQKYKRGFEEITSQIIRNGIRNALNNYGSKYEAEGLSNLVL